MGQDIKYIAIKKEIEVPNKIVHFVENDTLIFPIDFYDGEFVKLIEESHRFKTADQLFDFIITEVYSEDSVLESIQFLKGKCIETFAIVAHREILEIPQAYPCIVVVDNELIETKDIDRDPHIITGLNTLSSNILSNEKRYYSYDDAFYDYFQNDPEKELVRRFG